MSNVEVSAVSVSVPAYPPSVVPERMTEPRQAPKFISRKKKRSNVNVAKPTIHYPESDGMPMAESTVQYDNLTRTKGNIEFLYKHDPNVFVAGDLFWYPVKGRNDIVYAPDILIAFGPSKGKRGSYKQWEEGGISPQVIFEIWSPSNQQASKDAKFAFYNRYGVEEYYTYDPDKGKMEGWLRKDGRLQKIPEMSGWRSPRLGIQFTVKDTLDGPEMQLYYPDGTRFTSHEEDIEMKQEAEAQVKREAAARTEAEAQAEQAKEQLRVAMEQLKKAGLSLPDDQS